MIPDIMSSYCWIFLPTHHISPPTHLPTDCFLLHSPIVEDSADRYLSMDGCSKVTAGHGDWGEGCYAFYTLLPCDHCLSYSRWLRWYSTPCFRAICITRTIITAIASIFYLGISQRRSRRCLPASSTENTSVVLIELAQTICLFSLLLLCWKNWNWKCILMMLSEFQVMLSRSIRRCAPLKCHLSL
jgi:hypothetical protein